MEFNKEVLNTVIDHELNELEGYSSMLSKTVHDINNPLAVFIGQISIFEMLVKKDKMSPEKLAKIIEKLKSSTTKFQTRIEDLRSFYKVPVNDPTYNNLKQILESVSYYFENEIYKNEIDFNVNVEAVNNFSISSAKLFLVLRSVLTIIIKSLTDKDDSKISISLKTSMNILTLIIEYNIDDKINCFEDYENDNMLAVQMTKHVCEENNIELNYLKENHSKIEIIIPTSA